MLASGSTDCQPNHHGLMELFDCLCCHHSFFILLEKKNTMFWIRMIEGPDNRGPDNRGSTVIQNSTKSDTW